MRASSACSFFARARTIIFSFFYLPLSHTAPCKSGCHDFAPSLSGGSWTLFTLDWHYGLPPNPTNRDF